MSVTGLFFIMNRVLSLGRFLFRSPYRPRVSKDRAVDRGEGGGPRQGLKSLSMRDIYHLYGTLEVRE